MRVGVLYGGLGSEYDVSLRTGQQVLSNLPESYQGRGILIDKGGVWHLDGLPISPARAGRQVDVFFNALHGEYGEDGQVQMVLENLGLPYTGSTTVPSMLGMNKVEAREVFRRAGLKVVPGLLLDLVETGNDSLALARLVFSKISPAWVIKPVAGGSSVGIFFARTLPELAQAIETARDYSDKLLVEHYLCGREATCGVVDNWRGRDVYSLPPIEIRRPGNSPVWSYEDKYNGATEEVCPGAFDDATKQQLEALAVAAHQALGLRHYSRSDFIVSPHGIYILESNSLPGLTPESLLPKALRAVGCNYSDFLAHVLGLALNG